jgi:hypothetical protein
LRFLPNARGDGKTTDLDRHNDDQTSWPDQEGNDGKAVVTMPRVKRAVVNNNAPVPFISVVVDPLASSTAGSNNILNGGQQHHPNLGQQQLHNNNNDHQAAFDAGEEAAAAAMEA